MTFKPEHFAVWIEIPVTDLDRSTIFYNTVFKTELKIENTGPNPMGVFPTANSPMGVSGHIYPGKPAENGAGPSIHLMCPDALDETIKRVWDAGGKVLSDPIEIPPGRFAYCLDLDGNSIGLFEPKAA
ncbi:MAG: VOC family protein [Pseudomonadota bacterium]